jgi:hypothetical protein
MVTREVPLCNFYSVHARGALCVSIICQAPAPKLLLEAADETELNKIQACVENGILKISQNAQRTGFFKFPKPAGVHIQIPRLENITLEGANKVSLINAPHSANFFLNAEGANSGKVEASADTLEIRVRGTNNLSFSLRGKNLTTSIHGVNKVFLSGEVDFHQAEARGISLLDARNLLVQKTVAKASGLSRIKIKSKFQQS